MTPSETCAAAGRAKAMSMVTRASETTRVAGIGIPPPLPASIAHHRHSSPQISRRAPLHFAMTAGARGRAERGKRSFASIVYDTLTVLVPDRGFPQGTSMPVIIGPDGFLCGEDDPRAANHAFISET